MPKPKKTVSRFDLSNAVNLGNLGRPAATRNVQTVMVAVPDPAPDPNKGPGQRVVANANRRVDILEWERSHGRIGDDAYREGRVAQTIFERAASTGGGSTWREGSRVDAEIAKELAILRRIATAELTEDYLKFLRDALGAVDASIVRQVLSENRRYADVELPRRKLKAPDEEELYRRRAGKPPESHVSYIARRFRDALETLAIAAGQRR